jgi:hypothetical protein
MLCPSNAASWYQTSPNWSRRSFNSSTVNPSRRCVVNTDQQRIDLRADAWLDPPAGGFRIDSMRRAGRLHAAARVGRRVVGYRRRSGPRSQVTVRTV